VYSKFSKNKIWKKMKSPISMKDGTFNTSKCRGKLQCCTSILPKALAHSLHFPQKSKLFFLNCKKRKSHRLLGPAPWQIGDQRPDGPCGCPLAVARAPSFVLCTLFFQTPTPPLGTFGQLFLIGSSTCPPCLDFYSKLQTPITFDP
jgi:hypothetical protein